MIQMPYDLTPQGILPAIARGICEIHWPKSMLFVAGLVIALRVVLPILRRVW